jgi:PAS domain S-box-containing protein
MKERKIAINPPRRRYTDQFEFASMGFFTLDRNGRIIKTNSNSAKPLGVALDNLLKQQFSKFVAEDSRERFDAHCKQVFEDQSRESCDLKL